MGHVFLILIMVVVAFYIYQLNRIPKHYRQTQEDDEDDDDFTFEDIMMGEFIDKLKKK